MTVNSLKKLKVHRTGARCNPPTTLVMVVTFDEAKITCKGCLRRFGVRKAEKITTTKGAK